MAKFTIETTQEEQEIVMAALKKVEGEQVSVSKIATLANLPQSRVRYAIIDLLEARKIERVAAKAYNKHWVRYTYKIL